MGVITRVIAIDGPAGSGKSSVARLLAEALGYRMLNSGAVYRAITLHCLNAGVDSSQEEDVLAHLNSNRPVIVIEQQQDACCITLDGRDVSEKIRSADVTDAVSRVSALPFVRELALPLQHQQVTGKGLVAEGRDMGTVVFPSADIKFYVDASAATRAQRRMQDMQDSSVQGKSADTVLADIQRRDDFDSSREHAPLRVADDAIQISTDDLSLQQVVERMLTDIGNRWPLAGEKQA